MQLKQVLMEKGVWSQYLEVGIGPDAEIFTKSQIMSAVGHGMEAGLNPDFHLEQSRAGSCRRRHVPRQDRRRHARQ